MKVIAKSSRKKISSAMLGTYARGPVGPFFRPLAMPLGLAIFCNIACPQSVRAKVGRD